MERVFPPQAPTFPAAGNPGSETDNVNIYLFIPAFRIVKGNKYASVPRPRRFAHNPVAQRAYAWGPLNEFPMSALVAGANIHNDLFSQVPFWSFYESTKYAKQHVSDSDFALMKAVDGITRDPKKGVYMWEHVQVGSIVVHPADLGAPVNDRAPMICVEFLPEAELPAGLNTQLTRIVADVVTGRGAAAVITAHIKQIVFLIREQVADDEKAGGFEETEKGYFRLREDQCNTFRTVGGAATFNDNRYPLPAGGGEIIGAGAHAAFRQVLWTDHRRIQIEILRARGAYYLQHNYSPFYNYALYETAFRLPAGDAGGDAAAQAIHATRAAAITYAEKEPQNGRCGVPMHQRGVNPFIEGDNHLHAQVNSFPQVGGGGLLSAADFAKYNEKKFKLYIPVRRKVKNQFAGLKEASIECVEPFFGYCTGTSQLDCQHPLDTRKHGKNFPMTVQDYTYSYSRVPIQKPSPQLHEGPMDNTYGSRSWIT